MAVLYRSLRDFLKIDLDNGAVDRLPWRDFGNGLFMARLAREGRREFVLYRIRADANPDAFVKHEHIGGEIYLVLKGQIADETGDYREGDFVFFGCKIGAYAARGSATRWCWSCGRRACASSIRAQLRQRRCWAVFSPD